MFIPLCNGMKIISEFIYTFQLRLGFELLPASAG